MTDSGRHSALRQTSDGSFEIIFEDAELGEVSEAEPSVAEVTADEPRPAPQRTSKRVLALAGAGTFLLLVVGTVGWVLLSPSAKVDGEPEDVAGFKAYSGGAESTSDQPTPARSRPSAPVENAAEGEAAAHEITEDEPGWELTEVEEAAVIVEDEGVEQLPTDVVPEPEVIPDDAEADPAEAEPVEAEPVDPETVTEAEEEAVEEEGSAPSLDRFRTPRPALARPDLRRSFRTPRIPALNSNPLATQRMKDLPIRRIEPVGDDVEEEATDEELEEVE